MASRSRRGGNPLVLALCAALVASPMIEIFKFVAAHGTLSPDILPEQLGTMAGHALANFLPVFIVAAIILLIWNWISGATRKSDAR